MIWRGRARGERHAVLFLQSGSDFAADGQVHASAARHLPALGFGVYVACNPGAPVGSTSSWAAFSSVPGVVVAPAHFGPVVGNRQPLALALTIARDLWRTARGAAALVRSMRRNNIGIVHCTEKTRETIFGYVVARLTGARLVIHLHVKVEPWFSAPTRWVMHRADRLVAISGFVAASAVAMGYDPQRVVKVLNGSSPPLAIAGDPGPAPNERRSVRAEVGLGPDTAVISIVARVNPWKGHHQLIEAAADVMRTNGDVVLLIVGSDGTPATDGPDGTSLRTLAASLGIADRVHFLGYRFDSQRLIRASDVLAMPSIEEPFGLVYLEAMGAGVPVVAIDAGGAPEVVEHGVCGLLSAPGDTNGLAANLRKLLDDPELRAAMGSAGMRRAQSLFSAGRMARDLAEVYGSLLDTLN